MSSTSHSSLLIVVIISTQNKVVNKGHAEVYRTSVDELLQFHQLKRSFNHFNKFYLKAQKIPRFSMHECNAHFYVLSISSLRSWDVTPTTVLWRCLMVRSRHPVGNPKRKVWWAHQQVSLSCETKVYQTSRIKPNFRRLMLASFVTALDYLYDASFRALLCTSSNVEPAHNTTKNFAPTYNEVVNLTGLL
jgi:hypothetical protein